MEDTEERLFRILKETNMNDEEYVFRLVWEDVIYTIMDNIEPQAINSLTDEDIKNTYSEIKREIGDVIPWHEYLSELIKNTDAYSKLND